MDPVTFVRFERFLDGTSCYSLDLPEEEVQIVIVPECQRSRVEAHPGWGKWIKEWSGERQRPAKTVSFSPVGKELFDTYAPIIRLRSPQLFAKILV